MAKRHQDAINIQKGACNPSGIANSIVAACAEARAEGMNATDCPAVKLMVHQLAYICGVLEFERHESWQRAVAECEEKGGVKLS